MKPGCLLESDPINSYLATKPKMPFRIPEEVPNGTYGLVISGYSLVGNTNLQLCSPLPRKLFPRSNPLQGNFTILPLFHELFYFLSLQMPLPDRQLCSPFSRLE